MYRSICLFQQLLLKTAYKIPVYGPNNATAMTNGPFKQ